MPKQNKKSSQSERNTARAIAQQHKRSVEYKNTLGNKGLFEQTKTNERFFVGDQWLGNSTKSNMPLVVYNMIHRIIEYKLAQILSNPLTASFTAEGVPSFMNEEKRQGQKEVITDLQGGSTEGFDNLSENDKINLTFYALSDYYNATDERLKLKEKYAEAAKNASISGTGALYAYWDESINTGLFSGSDKSTSITGDVEVEVLNAEQQLDFENPAEADVNKQDWIIISKKMTVDKVKRIAKLNGVSNEDIQKIKADEGESFSYERDDISNDTVSRVTVMTKLFKEFSEDGKSYSIWAVQCTEHVVIRPEWDTEMTRYPIALFDWEKRGNCIFGDSEITYLIPNQIAVNRMVTASVWSAMLTGMPIMLVDRNKVQGEITNQPGQIWEFNGQDEIRNAAAYLQPPTISSALISNTTDIINNTMSNAGATDAALGNLRPDNATAVIALREAATAPMQMLKNRYYQFVEDFVRILADFWINYYGTRQLKISDKQGSWYLPFEGENFKNLVLSVRIDVGASTIWSQAQAQQILDNLLSLQKIDFIQYLERLPKGLITDVQGLIEDFKESQAAQQKIYDEQIQSKNNIDNLGADDFYSQLSPEEREKFDSMSYEEQQALIENAKSGVREENALNEDEMY